MNSPGTCLAVEEPTLPETEFKKARQCDQTKYMS